MIAVELLGGLGNQMFQYATAKALSLDRNDKLILDKNLFISYLRHNYSLSHFNIDAPFLEEEIVLDPTLPEKIKALISGKKTFAKYQETELPFDPELFNKTDKNIYLKGYFQTEKYFIQHAEQIRKDFEITSPLKILTQNMLRTIAAENSVSLHIRRGDYVSNPEANAFHGTCDLNYYHRAVSILNETIENAVFFIFSDDIAWAKENLKIDNRTYYIDFNDAASNFEDIKLMSACQHNIIANSSFSWWGAWLNDNNTKTVIAPKKWFNNDTHSSEDIIPESWLKI